MAGRHGSIQAFPTSFTRVRAYRPLSGEVQGPAPFAPSTFAPRNCPRSGEVQSRRDHPTVLNPPAQPPPVRRGAKWFAAPFECQTRARAPGHAKNKHPPGAGRGTCPAPGAGGRMAASGETAGGAWWGAIRSGIPLRRWGRAPVAPDNATCKAALHASASGCPRATAPGQARCKVAGITRPF